MNLLSLIIERLNQRVATHNLFDQIYGLSELNQNGNEKAWVNYIGEGQAQVVSDYDGANGTLFWAKRGRVAISQNERYNSISCKQLYLISIPLTAYGIVRRSSLPCDTADSVDFVATEIFKYVSGKDVDFRLATGLIQYDVIPTGYGEETKTLTKNLEWACVTVDFNIEIITDSSEGCYAACENVPLPPYVPSPNNCCNISIYDEGVLLTNNVRQINFEGAGVTASSDANSVTVTINGGGSGVAAWGSIGTGTGVASQADLVAYLAANFYPLLGNPSGFLLATALIPYLTSATAALTYYPIPTGNTSQYVRGDGTLANFPAISSGTVTDFIFTDGNGFTGTVTLSTTTPTLSLTLQIASGSQNGQLSSTDWNTFNNKLSAAITSLNGLTGATQTFATGTTGTDFGISSAGTVHTFNIPTASAANRGLLSAADWSSFNSKGNGTVTSVGITAGTGINVSGSPITTNGSITVTNSAPDQTVVLNAGTGIGVTGTYPNFTVTNNSPSSGGTVTSVAALTLGTSGTDLASSVANGTTTPVITLNVPTASATNRGALSSADWSTFNAKQSAISPAALTKTDDTNITLTLGGTPSTALLQAVSLTLGWTGRLAASRVFSMATASILGRNTAGTGDIEVLTAIPDGITATTQPVADNSTKIATTAYVTTAIKTFSPYNRQVFTNRNNSGAYGIVYCSTNDVVYICNNNQNLVYCYNVTSGELKASLAITAPVAAFFLPVKGEIYITSSSSGTITRVSTAATPTSLGTITGSGTWGACLVEYSSTKVFIGNQVSNNFTVINPTTNTVAATVAGVTAPIGMTLNSNGSSAQNGRIVVSAANGVTIIDPSTNTVSAATSTVGGVISSGRRIEYISSLDLYALTDYGNNRVLYLTPATATTFTASAYTYSINMCYDIAIDTVNNLMLVGGSNVFVTSSTIPTPIVLYIIDLATKAVLRSSISLTTNTTSFYQSNWLSIRSNSVLIGGAGSTLTSEMVYS